MAVSSHPGVDGTQPLVQQPRLQLVANAVLVVCRSGTSGREGIHVYAT